MNRGMRPWLWLTWILVATGGCLVTNVVFEPDPACTRQCAVKPTELTGTRQAGQACTYAAECLPVCCSCGTDSTETVLLAGCRMGRCLKTEDVCAPKTMGTLCTQRDKEPCTGTTGVTP